MRVTEQSLRHLVADILCAAGSPSSDASAVAKHLVDANLMGHDSHGVQLVRRYVEHIQKGLCRPGTQVNCINDAGAILQFDGQRGFGVCVGTQAINQSIARCKSTGVVVMTLRNAHHIGRVGAYAETALSAGMISLHFVNVVDHAPMVAPFMGKDARFGTNPICIGIPGSSQTAPFLLDMATSAVAMGKVVVAHQSGTSVPANAIIDASGQPTIDPAKYLGPPQGALLPFGLHKGYGLMLACEILAGAMSGFGTIQPGTPRYGSIINNMFSIIIDPTRLGDIGSISTEIDHLIAYLKSAPTIDGGKVVIAGEPEAVARKDRSTNGIALPAGTMADLELACEISKLGKNAISLLESPIKTSN
jgi:hydroxycarboxylate dehydrogenase B